MPTKRRRVVRGRNGATTMDDLQFEQLLQLAAGWSPGKANANEQRYTKWETWGDFMATWVAVRDEYLARKQWGATPVFAEQVYKIYGAKGPPANATYEDMLVAFAAAEDDNVAELLASVNL